MSGSVIPNGLLDENNENTIWTGQPISKYRAGRYYLFQIAGILSVATFMTIWSAMVALGGNNRWDQGRIVKHFEPHNVALSCIALTLTLIWVTANLPSLLASYHIHKNASYIITDKRIIIIEGKSTVHEFVNSTINLIRIRERHDGSGDLVLRYDPTCFRGVSMPVGFMGIKDVRKVGNILSSLHGTALTFIN